MVYIIICIWSAAVSEAVLMPISPSLPFLRSEILDMDAYAAYAAYAPERSRVNDTAPEQRCYADFYWPHFSILAPTSLAICGFLEVK